MDLLSQTLKIWLKNYQERPIEIQSYKLIVRFKEFIKADELSDERYQWKHISSHFWSIDICIPDKYNIYQTIMDDLTKISSLPGVRRINGPGIN